MKTTDAIGYIERMICEQERYEEYVLKEKSEDEELLHEAECELEALRMAKTGAEGENMTKFDFEPYAYTDEYGVILHIGDNVFVCNVREGEIIDGAYRRLNEQLHEEYGNYEEKPDYSDIVNAQAYILHLLVMLKEQQEENNENKGE